MSRSQSAASVSPYDIFATIYDHFFGPEALPATLKALRPLMLDRLPRRAHILDLCCGTGELSHALVERGFRVHGIDNSSEMLRLARVRSPQASFELADMRSFDVDRHFNAAICAYNSVPHIMTLPDLGRVFKNVRRSLLPAGAFVFDLYSEEAYRERWRGSFTQQNENLQCMVKPSYDPHTRLGVNEIRIRLRDGRESQLNLTTRCYSAAELEFCLRAAGFVSVESFDAKRDLGLPEASGRIFWRCSTAGSSGPE